jgi:hypothetical protein
MLSAVETMRMEKSPKTGAASAQCRGVNVAAKRVLLVDA